MPLVESPRVYPAIASTTRGTTRGTGRNLLTSSREPWLDHYMETTTRPAPTRHPALAARERCERRAAQYRTLYRILTEANGDREARRIARREAARWERAAARYVIPGE